MSVASRMRRPLSIWGLLRRTALAVVLVFGAAAAVLGGAFSAKADTVIRPCGGLAVFPKSYRGHWSDPGSMVVRRPSEFTDWFSVRPNDEGRIRWWCNPSRSDQGGDQGGRRGWSPRSWRDAHRKGAVMACVLDRGVAVVVRRRKDVRGCQGFIRLPKSGEWRKAKARCENRSGNIRVLFLRDRELNIKCGRKGGRSR